MPKMPRQAASPEAADRAAGLASILREIRAGRLPSTHAVNGFRLLSRVSVCPRVGTVFYHLAPECRVALLDGARLPW